MENNLFKLTVDEETQGYSKEFTSIDELAKTLDSLLDKQVIEVNVKRKGIAGGDSISIPGI